MITDLNGQQIIVLSLPRGHTSVICYAPHHCVTVDFGLESGDDRPLSATMIYHLNRNTPRLIELLDLDSGLDRQLVSVGCITERQRSSIMAAQDGYKRNEKLLDIITRRSVVHLNKFADCLAWQCQALNRHALFLYCYIQEVS